tara:strand:+ start:3725 stop:4699 length:975 start_codon:yes stop_codon:yes gene_type:complete
MILKSFNLNTSKILSFKVVLLYGNNLGLKQETIQNHFIQDFEGQITKIDESQILENLNDFIESIMNQSLFEEKKLIIISGVTNKILKFLDEYLEKNIKGTKILLNSENLDKKSKLRLRFEKEKNLACVPFYEDSVQSLSSFANNFLSKKNIKISREIINLVVERARGDRANLKNELEKIEVLSITRKNISTEDVLKLTNLAENYDIFELVNNYLSKNKKKVSKIINENNFINEDCVIIIRTLLSRSKRLLELKKKEKINSNKEQVIMSFKPPIFWKEKDIVKIQMSEWSEEEIKNKIYELTDLEILVKSNTSGINLVSDFVNNY